MPSRKSSRNQNDYIASNSVRWAIRCEQGNVGTINVRSLTSTWKPCLSRGKGMVKKKWKSFMTFAIKGGAFWVPLRFSRPQKQGFFVQKHWFKPFLVCFENGKWKSAKKSFNIVSFFWTLPLTVWFVVLWQCFGCVCGRGEGGSVKEKSFFLYFYFTKHQLSPPHPLRNPLLTLLMAFSQW